MPVSLANPKIPYITLRNALRDLFRSNKTALNVDLTASGGTFVNNNQIVIGNPEIENTPLELYPIIYVLLVRKVEEFRSIGNAGRKLPRITFRIFGITADMSTERYDNTVRLVENMEGILRDNIQFDSNVVISDPTITDIGLAELSPEVYINAIAMDLVVTVEIK